MNDTNEKVIKLTQTGEVEEPSYLTRSVTKEEILESLEASRRQEKADEIKSSETQ